MSNKLREFEIKLEKNMCNNSTINNIKSTLDKLNNDIKILSERFHLKNTTSPSDNKYENSLSAQMNEYMKRSNRVVILVIPQPRLLQLDAKMHDKKTLENIFTHLDIDCNNIKYFFRL
jgi:hypothetical protein